MDYMKAVIRDEAVPDLPYFEHEGFNEKNVNQVMSNMMSVMNHVVPDKEREIKQNAKKYQRVQQNMLSRRKSADWERSNKSLDSSSFMQDATGKRKRNSRLTKKQREEAVLRDQRGSRAAAGWMCLGIRMTTTRCINMEKAIYFCRVI